jgi:hypothetical protein
VPALPNEVYFNAAPVLDLVPITFAGRMVNVHGVKIPVGTSKTIDVDLFSDAMTSGPFTVTALDYAAAMGQPKELSFSFDHATGVNGDVLKLTITKTLAARAGYSGFILRSTLGSSAGYWFGVVAD